MKKLISMLLAVIMITSVTTVPVFAGSNECAYGLEYREAAMVRKTDEHGKTIYVSGNAVNNKVFSLSDAPEMNYTKTIGNVTFSNYIKHIEKTLTANDRTKINVIQVYVGIGASMRSNVGNVEFLRSGGQTFRFVPGPLTAATGKYDSDWPLDCDLVQIKTNTPVCIVDTGAPDYDYLDRYAIRPYTNGGRNNDGTWEKGLTWVFEENPKSRKSDGSYIGIHPIEVLYNGTTTYYQVIVTDDTNFAAAEVETPVEETRPETPVLKSFDDVDPVWWSYNAIMICVEKGAISGIRTPDANGVGSFAPAGKVTLGQFLAVITRLVCPDAIKDGHWALRNYNAAVECNMIKAEDFESTAAALDATISREDMAYILVGAAKANGEELKAIDGIESIIPDFSSISGSRRDAVLKCYSNGLITGYADGSFGYADAMTREQMATVVCRLMEYAPRVEVKFGEGTVE